MQEFSIAEYGFLIVSSLENLHNIYFYLLLYSERIPMTTFQISAYHIQIAPDLEQCTFTGVARICITPLSPTSVVTLNALELDISKCLMLVEGKTQPCDYELEASEEELKITLPKPESSEFQLTIDYNGAINDKMTGFYRSSYLADDVSMPLAVTQFQESSARMAFPCQDHPKYKAGFEIELVVDDHLTAVSNTRVKAIHRLKEGKKRVCFYPTPPMSTYLVFFGVGRFDFIGDSEDRRLGLISTPGFSDYGKFGLAFGRKALQFCEEYYGIPYPLDKMDLLAIPDFAFGAMENWGAITFRENLLLYVPGVTSQAGRLRICEVIAHEIAHQWFGNLVTPRDWRYLWLNESFATYFGFGVVDHYYPQWQVWDQFIYSQTQSAFSRDSLIENFAIEIPGGAHVVINSSTAPLIYSKGGSILRQIEGYMGKELFRRGIEKYLNTHAYGCAASHHLWEAFEAVSKMPITAIMKSWIEQPGHPVIDAQRNGNTVTLSQKRFTYLPHESSQSWQIPLSITIFSNDGSRRTKTHLMDGPQAEVDLGEGCGAYKLNAGHTGFYKVKYTDRDNQDKLLAYAASRALPPADRWGLQLDLFAQVLCGNAGIAEYLDSLSHYLSENEFLPLISIMDNLFLIYRIVDPKWQPSIADVGRSFAENILNRVGWEPSEDEAHTTSFLRDHILWPAAIFGLKGTSDFARSKFSLLQKDASVHPDIQKSVLQLAASAGDEHVLKWFQDRAITSSSEHERLNIYSALGCFKNWEIARKALDFALSKTPARNQFIPIAAAAENPYISPFVWQWYTENTETLEQMHPLLYERVIMAVAPFCGLHQYADVKDYFTRHLEQSDLAGDAVRLSLERLEVFMKIRKFHEKTAPPEVVDSGR